MNAVMKYDPEFELKRAHVDLLKHPETCQYAGIIMMGESSVVHDPKLCPTAYTDGVNKRYGAKFMEKLTRPQVAGLVMHENFHVLLKHLPRHRDLMKKNARLANVAMDYVVNDMIHDIKDKAVVQLPPGALYHPMFAGWSVRQVYDYLEKDAEENDGGGMGGGEPLDEHDFDAIDKMTPEEIKQHDEKVQEAIHQGGLLAGKFGNKLPRQITDLMKPEIDWREVLRDFWTSAMRGYDEYTYARMNRRRLADDLYLPTMYSEKIGRVVLGIDTSGSIDQYQLNLVASHVKQLCEVMPPDEVVILWWDTKVRGKQVFTEGNYANIASLMKPAGGGGTTAACVSKYMTEHRMDADCLIMLTDGHIEDNLDWKVATPTLWIIDKNGNKSFKAPAGTQKVNINN
jgi:predicted metal-dependent peptidase